VVKEELDPLRKKGREQKEDQEGQEGPGGSEQQAPGQQEGGQNA